LPDDEAHHVTHVLRLKPGAPVSIFDGAGREWHATIATTGRSGTSATLDAPVTPVAEPAVAVTLGVALQKGDRMDTIVGEATALGVAVVAPLSTAHVALPARARESTAAIARWQRVAVAAVKQCGRAVVPVIRPVAPLDDMLRQWSGGPILVSVEPGRVRPVWGPDAVGPGPRPDAALLLVGPEGGWDEDEVRLLANAGARRLSLGPRTLRGDLAPAVALSLLWAHWGWQA
jgi:16S rRNA (uracil1498-N3)-methyltransferase